MGQSADKGPSQAAGNQFVKFSRGAAQRIAKAVRVVEGGDRGQPGVTFEHPHPMPQQILKVATFTGEWATGTWKVVTLTNSTATASVYNWTTPVPAAEGCTGVGRYVVFGRAGGTNSLLEVQLHATCSTCVSALGGLSIESIANYDAGQVQILGHTTTGPCLYWYSVTTCSTSTAA